MMLNIRSVFSIKQSLSNKTDRNEIVFYFFKKKG